MEQAHVPPLLYYLAIKKTELMPYVATWIVLEIIILSRADRDRNILYHLYVESNKNDRK